MTHGVLTNKFNAVYNYKMIDRDFDIYMVTKESKWLDKTNILDIASSAFKALSVQYTFGRTALVLFKKESVDEFVFRRELQDKFKDVTVQRVDIFDSALREKIFYYNERLLAQLLINSIRSPKNENFAYHNLTGKLFYFDNKWQIRDKTSKKVSMFYGLEVALTPGMYLQLSVQSFRLKKNEKNVREYIFDSKTGNVRKKLRDDEKGDSYIDGSFKSSHNTVNYLDFASIDNYKRSKLGVMRNFLHDVHKYLGEYITLTPEYKDNVSSFEIPKVQRNVLDNKHLAMLIDKAIYIVDELKTEYSEQLVKKLKFELEYFYGLEPIVGELNSNAYNIRIIHDSEYYMENGIPDMHNDIPIGVIVQHVTVESVIESKYVDEIIEKKASPMINKVIQELLIKNDVIQSNVAIFDWKSLNFNKTWTFVMRQKIATEFSLQKKSYTNTIGEKKYDYYQYAMVTIFSDGAMHFERFCNNQPNLNKEQEVVVHFYEKANYQEQKIKNIVEGLVYSSIDNIHAIVRTPMTTMPDIIAIWNGLEETDKKTQLSIEQLDDALSEFIKYVPQYSNYVYHLKNELSNFQGLITKEDFRKIMNYRQNRNAAKSWHSFLYNNYGIRILAEIKAQDFNAVYLIDNVLDIKYYSEINHEGRKELRYFVGTKRKSLKTSIHNACTVRKVTTDNDEIEFEELLPLLAVDFVRNNQHTVLPFPYKYLREYLSFGN